MFSGTAVTTGRKLLNGMIRLDKRGRDAPDQKVGRIWMSLRFMQPSLLLVLAACGASNSANAVAPSSDPPFSVAPVATFGSPSALAFLPGTHDALVTEMLGQLKLLD